MKDRIKVVARIRPSVPSDTYKVDDRSVFADGKQYRFDKVLGRDQCQADIYETVSPIIEEILKGYNATIFVYGQTSSGKTYTMEGALKGANRGIIPRVIDDMFDHISKLEDRIEFNINISYYEIYMEKIRDLLDPSKNNLSVHEDERKTTYVKNVTERYVETSQQIMDILKEGQQNRAVAVTDLNEHSSRSHSVFQITITQYNLGKKLTSKLYLVDLAGSEKTSKTNAQGMTLEEARKINTSLLCLGKVIASLSEGQSHVPYRDSKLTRCLQHSLGGNSRTMIIICMSLDSSSESETKSTLTFGTRAKKIKNIVTPNIELSHEELKRRYEELSERYSLCNTELARWKKGETTSSLTPAPLIPTIRPSTLQHSCPCLINLNEDPREGDYLNINIPEGAVLLVGSGEGTVDILLRDVCIQPVHCKLENRDNRVYLKPSDSEAMVFVNGQIKDDEVALSHGDRVIFGGSKYFRFTGPGGGMILLPQNTLRSVVDYQFARAELINSVNHQKYTQLLRDNSNVQRDLERAKEKISELTSELEYFKSESEVKSVGMDSQSSQCSQKEEDEAMDRLFMLSEQLRESIMKGRVQKQDKSLQMSSYLDSCDSLLSDTTFNTYLKMSEASKLCKLLNRNIVFSREVMCLDSTSDVFVRAADLGCNRAIVWSNTTFCERVESLKAFYQKQCQAGFVSCDTTPLTVIFGNDEVWETDMSILSDSMSVLSETRLSTSSSSASFLSTASTTSKYTRSLSSPTDCTSVLCLLTGSATTTPAISGSPLCDTLLDSVRTLYSTLALLPDRDVSMLPRLTHATVAVHTHCNVWTSQCAANSRLCPAVQDVVSSVKIIAQRLLEGRSVHEVDLSRTQDLLLDVVSQAGQLHAANILDNGVSGGAARPRSRAHSLTVEEVKEAVDLDVTSDYNSSGSFTETSLSDEKIREKLYEGVKYYLDTMIDETIEGLDSVLRLSASVSEHLKENVNKLNCVLRNKKRELTNLFDSSSLDSGLDDVITPPQFFTKVREVQSWSRIITVNVSDKENSPSPCHVTQQLNTKIQNVLNLTSFSKVFTSTPRRKLSNNLEV